MTLLRSALPLHHQISPLQILLLIQLESSPKYGYEMLKTIKDAFDGVWQPRTGTIYPALKSLERRSLVETQVKNGVGFYYITPSGRQFLQKIGSQQALNMKFSLRFLETLKKWMSSELKRSIISNITSIADEDLNLIGGIVDFLDDSIEQETKLQFLLKLRSNLSKRLIELDEMINELEAKSS